MDPDSSMPLPESVTPDDARYPRALRDEEEKRVAARRRSVGVEADRDAWVGMGLSGGGIRSATFCLGLFQALARAGLVRKIDFLSTVSGGGYFGGFFGALFSRDAVHGPEQVQEILEEKDDRGIVGYLRDNGRYLSPNGSGDLLLAGGVLLRNWVALQIVVLTLVFACIAFIRWVALAAANSPWPALHPGWLEQGPVQWSPWIIAALAVLLAWVFPAGWSYWLIGESRGAWAGWVVVLGLGLALRWSPWIDSYFPAPFAVGLLAIGLSLLVLVNFIPVWLGARGLRGSDASGNTARLTKRNLASRNLKYALLALGGLLGIALLDTIGGFLYANAILGPSQLIPRLGSGVASLTALAGLAGKVAKLFARDGKRPSLPLNLVATVVAVLLVALILIGLSVLSYGFAWSWMQPPTATSVAPLPARWLQGAIGVAVLFSLLFGHVWNFVNRSTQQPLYGARLTRAYLGASNPNREWGTPLYKVLRGDDVPLGEYWSPLVHGKGAPLHLINVTVNETVDGRTHVQQQDRKGCPLAVGPCGLSLGVRHHLPLDWGNRQVPGAVMTRDAKAFHVFRQEPGPFKGEGLSLGNWISISGAAFSTGIGYRTSLGLSLLTGLANVRLGYWWNPGQRATRRPWFRMLFPTQSYILSEFVARFPGTAWKRWYLSDGGHFENLAGYELIRRRLKRIVIVDAECDPDYQFGGLANLVRKARIDFGTEITFWDEKKIGGLGGDGGRLPIGTLKDLKRDTNEDVSGACAALADVHYDDGSVGTLLYVKTALCDDAPVDLTEYHAKHPEFPHESTADQFFDDAQWESYRKLGEFIGTQLFGEGASPSMTGQVRLREKLFGNGAVVRS